MKKKKEPIPKTIERESKLWLAKTLLALVGSVDEKDRFEGPLNSIIIQAQEKIGDAILLTPLLKLLRTALPEAEIHLVTYSSVYTFFKDDPHIDEVHRGKNHYATFYKAMQGREFDVLYSTKDHFSFTFVYQARLIPARYRVGIEHPLHAGFFHRLIRMDFHQHVVEKNCALLDLLNIPYRKEDCRPYLPEGDVSEPVRKFATQLSAHRPVGINLSAGEKDREWTLEKWVDLLNRMDHPVVVLAMPDRAKDKHFLETRFDHVIPSPQTRSIYDAGQIIQRLKVLISPDTSLVHVASCYGTPVAGLYRADLDHIERFYPYAVPHRVLASPTHRVADIGVESVISAVDELIHNGNNGMGNRPIEAHVVTIKRAIGRTPGP